MPSDDWRSIGGVHKPSTEACVTTARLARISPTTREAIFSLRRKGLSARAISRQLDMRLGTVCELVRAADERTESRIAADAAGVPIDVMVALKEWTRQMLCHGCDAPILFLISQPSVRCRMCGRVHQTRVA